MLFHTMRSALTIFVAIYIFRESKSWKYAYHVKVTQIDNSYYSLTSNICIPTQAGYKFAGIFIFVVPLAFDLLLVVLTVIRAYRNAVLLKAELGSSVVRLFPLILLLIT